MLLCDRGVQMLITTVGAFAAFSLMTIAVGTDYWLYSRGVCKTKVNHENETSRKNEEVMTHSGLWRTCCLEGTFRGVCKKIDHFPEDADYKQDTAEYLLLWFEEDLKYGLKNVIFKETFQHRPIKVLQCFIMLTDHSHTQICSYTPCRLHPEYAHFYAVFRFLVSVEQLSERTIESNMAKGALRASSVFPIMSVGLLFMGGLCVAASEFYRSKHNVILSAGIFFVSAGLSNIIGIIVYISANSGDPGQSDSKKSYSYGWSFYFGALSFIMAETVGVLAVHMFIEKHRKQQRAKTLVKKSSLGFGRIPTYRYRFGRRSSETPSRDVPMFTLSRDSDKTAAGKLLDSDRDFLHNSNAKDAANRRTTPV
ncbi:hypothetical protein QTP70_032377 [Hemibagrus guttatus]|uniref:Voltage-dependent calcium channel gamma-3 subunit n=1 Tax=Hemibagrus guttatus TaxID=175788 RepID=A0AAE0QIP4_9TELE|nr:hypothetical protein QTP70_032377 [Hemibagrus guttatus]